MIKNIRIVGPKSLNKKDAINTTSSSNNWSRGLSPFFIGPVELYAGYSAKKFENAYQFCKVYSNFVSPTGEILDEYWNWAKKGWESEWAHRFPMGKGAIPLFSLWDGERLGYVEGRKKIYIPLYKDCVQKTEAYKKLKDIFVKNETITLFDYDGYDFLMTKDNQDEVINNPNKKMGHAFVLAMSLLEEID